MDYLNDSCCQRKCCSESIYRVRLRCVVANYFPFFSLNKLKTTKYHKRIAWVRGSLFPPHDVLLACSPLDILGPPQPTTDPILPCNYSIIQPPRQTSAAGHWPHLQNRPPKWLRAWARTCSLSYFGPCLKNQKVSGTLIMLATSGAHFFPTCIRAKNSSWSLCVGPNAFWISSPFGPHLTCPSIAWGRPSLSCMIVLFTE